MTPTSIGLLGSSMRESRRDWCYSRNSFYSDADVGGTHALFLWTCVLVLAPDDASLTHLAVICWLRKTLILRVKVRTIVFFCIKTNNDGCNWVPTIKILR